METKKCPNCNKDIPKDAKKCPECKKDLRGWAQKHPILTILGSLLVLIILLSLIGDNETTEKVEVNNNTNNTVVEKTYQQVFSFSGSGTKKSEPFNITGERFKIEYDCKEDNTVTYCGAFVYKVGSNLPQAVMNSQKAIKDETIIYTNLAGQGEYYIDANTIGNFEMKVYDYK